MFRRIMSSALLVLALLAGITPADAQPREVAKPTVSADSRPYDPGRLRRLWGGLWLCLLASVGGGETSTSTSPTEEPPGDDEGHGHADPNGFGDPSSPVEVN